MAEITEFSPSAFANEMQLRARKAQDFDTFEASLPDPRSPTFSSSSASSYLPDFSLSDAFNKILAKNPFGRDVNSEDIVWLFDNTAYQSPDHRLHTVWEAEFVAAVFEKDCRCKVADVVSSLAEKLGLADDEEGKKRIEERVKPFLWDVRPVKVARVGGLLGEKIKLNPTGMNGITTSTQKLEKQKEGTAVKAKLIDAPGAEGIVEATTYYAGPSGWAILSDIDDTIKVTLTSSPTGILRSTFVDDPVPIPGMPQLYSSIQSLLPRDTPWLYLSASPYNLYPFLKDFRDQHFPQGTMVLRDASWRTIAGLLSALTMGTEEYKADRMKKMRGWLPQRKMIVFGDSTQSDPEAYGEIYRTFPGWIRMIFIRKATDVSAIGIKDKNEPERFEKAFKDLPREAWHVFEEPGECLPLIEKLVAAEGPE